MSDLYLNFGKQVPLLMILLQIFCLAHFFYNFNTAKSYTRSENHDLGSQTLRTTLINFYDSIPGYTIDLCSRYDAIRCNVAG